jgi:preprotein translocase subunit YajC
MQYLILPLLLLAMYFLVIRPQQQRIRAQQSLVAALQVGDEVVSSSGIYGRITDLTDDIAMLEVADGIELRLARGAIARRLTDGGFEDADDDDPAELVEDTDVDDPEVGR